MVKEFNALLAKLFAYGLNQKQIAQQAGISESYLSKLKKGRVTEASYYHPMHKLSQLLAGIENDELDIQEIFDSSPLPNKQKRRRAIYLLVIGLILISAITMIILWPKQTDPVKIQVWTTFEAGADDDFLNWLVASFNQKFENHNPRYVLEINADQENQPGMDIINHGDGRSKADVLLGGPPEAYQRFDNLVELDIDFAKFDLPDCAIAADKKWTGASIGFLGLVMNKFLIEPEHAVETFEDLANINSPRACIASYFFPPPATTISSYQLYFALGLDKETGSFNHDRAVEKYRKLCAGSSSIEDQKNTDETKATNLDLVNAGRGVAGVEWLNDATWKATSENWKREYPQVVAKIPANAVPSMECMAVNRRPDGDIKGAMEFVRFFLSEGVQRKHFELQKRLPVSKKILQSIFENDESAYIQSAKKHLEIMRQNKVPWNYVDLYKKNKIDRSALEKYPLKTKENLERLSNEIKFERLKNCPDTGGFVLSSN